jgi:hypothetical protein
MLSTYTIKKNKQGHIGCALIINNYSFKSKPRLGSDVDVRSVKKTLENINIDVREPHVDLSAAEMKDLMQRYAKKCDFSDYSCFMCFIMSHGLSNSRIFGVDDRAVHLINDIVEPLKGCLTLLGKPKLFFVQACRGEHQPHNVEVVEEDNASGGLLGIDTIDAMLHRRIPTEADILIHYSTVEKYVAYRNKSNGSFFVESLCHVLDEHALSCNAEINQLLVEVNNRVATVHNAQMPQITNQLRKRLYFNLDEPENRNIAVRLRENSTTASYGRKNDDDVDSEK